MVGNVNKYTTRKAKCNRYILFLPRSLQKHTLKPRHIRNRKVVIKNECENIDNELAIRMVQTRYLKVSYLALDSGALSRRYQCLSIHPKYVANKSRAATTEYRGRSTIFRVHENRPLRVLMIDNLVITSGFGTQQWVLGFLSA